MVVSVSNFQSISSVVELTELNCIKSENQLAISNASSLVFDTYTTTFLVDTSLQVNTFSFCNNGKIEGNEECDDINTIT